MDSETLQPRIKAGEIDYSDKWYVMAAVGMGLFLSTIDGSIVNVALPTLESSYNTTFPIVQWVVLAYLLTVTTLMLSVGRFADMIGKKYIYVSGFVIFTLGSALCGLAPTIYWLVGFRVLQGVGAAMIMALGTAIITEAFPSNERGTALGISGSIISLGIVIGPTLGGLLIQSISWHWIFYVNLPVGILGTWLALRYIPAIRPVTHQRFDIPGALLLFITLLCLLISLTVGQNTGFNSPLVFLLLFLFAVGLALFIMTELRQDEPMIDLRLFRNQELSINLATAVLMFICIAGTLILMPFYLQNVLGYNPEQTGLMLAVVPVMLGISSPLSGILSDRVGTRLISTLGLGILLLGYLAVSTLSTQTTTLGYLLRFVPIGLGIGIFLSPNNSAIMGAAPRDRLGIVSGILAVSRTLGQITGIAVLGAIWSSLVFRYAGTWLEGGATEAAPAIQVAALQGTFLVAAGLVVLAFGLSLLAFKISTRGVIMELGFDPIPLCQEFVRIPSLSGQESNVMAHVLSSMRSFGFDEAWQDRAGNTIGVLRGQRSGSPQRLLVDIHTDTVPVTSLQSWQHDPFGGELSGGRIYGRGAVDIKAGLACALTGMASLNREDFSGEIWVAATVMEEMIEGAATNIVLESAAERGGLPDYCIVIEPTLLKIGTAQKGRAGIRMQASGIPAHTSRAELGVNAVYKMLPAIQGVRDMPKRSDELLGMEVFELVEILSSPLPGNSIVPDGCRARFDCRLLLGETADSLLDRFRRAIPEDVDVDLWPVSVDLYTGESLEKGDFHMAWSISPTEPLPRAALQALQAIGLPAETYKVPYCCNASAVTQRGIPVIVFGPGDISQAHAIDEWVEAAQLPIAARVLGNLALNLLG